MTPTNSYLARLLVDARQRDLMAVAPPRPTRRYRPWTWLQWRPLPLSSPGDRGAGSPVASSIARAVPPAAPCRA